MRSIHSLSAVFACVGAATFAHAADPATTSSAAATPEATPPATSATPPADDLGPDPTAPHGNGAAGAPAVPDAATADDLGPDPTAPQGTGHFPGDPYEKLNRKIWAFDIAIDKAVLRPASSVYRHVTPKPLRHGLSRVIANLEEPWSFVNNVLQGHPNRAARNLGRFLVNTTIGVSGLADHASGLGIHPADEDFGQTLAVWGVMKSSPYLVLPLLGPSTIRDGIGMIVAGYADPYRICLQYCVDTNFWIRAGVTAFTAVSARADATEAGADSFLASSLDPYAAARSGYLQQRAGAIANEDDNGGGADAAGAPPEGTPMPAAPAAAVMPDGGATMPSAAPTPAPTATPAAQPDAGSKPPPGGD